MKKNKKSNIKSFLIIGSKRFKKSTVNSMIEESKKLFDSVTFVTVDKIEVKTEDGEVDLVYKGKSLLGYSAIYPRFSSKDYVMGEAILKVIENSNIYCPVNLQSYQITNHKYFTAQRLSDKGIPGVVTTFFISPKFAELSVQETGYPVVMKLISGFAGKGVVLIHDKKQMESILDAVHLFEEFISMQKFIKGENKDIRCYVIGKEVIAVQRTGKKGDWRANISRGGTAQVLEPNEEMKKIALDAASVLGMDICAIDLMVSQKGYVIIEVNFMPGPFMKYLGNDIITKWVSFIRQKVEN
jgi:ribosomal protein S6--L-glutamate ligase